MLMKTVRTGKLCKNELYNTVDSIPIKYSGFLCANNVMSRVDGRYK